MKKSSVVALTLDFFMGKVNSKCEKIIKNFIEAP